MSDLERVRNFVAEQGYEFIWRSPDGYEEVWRKGNVDVSLDEISEKANITVPLSDLPSILSSLTQTLEAGVVVVPVEEYEALVSYAEELDEIESRMGNYSEQRIMVIHTANARLQQNGGEGR